MLVLIWFELVLSCLNWSDLFLESGCAAIFRQGACIDDGDWPSMEKENAKGNRESGVDAQDNTLSLTTTITYTYLFLNEHLHTSYWCGYVLCVWVSAAWVKCVTQLIGMMAPNGRAKHIQKHRR